MKTMRFACILTALACAALCGCASRSLPPYLHIEPVAQRDSPQMCVIANRYMRASVLESYENALRGRGFAVRVLPDLANRFDCPMVSTYSFTNQIRGMDLGRRMFVIEVFIQGTRAGEVAYNTGRYGGSGRSRYYIWERSDFIFMVDQLFPSVAPPAKTLPPY